MFWPNLSEQENDAVDHAEALEAVGGWRTTLILRQVTAIKHSEEDSGCTNCLCMENWYRTGCPSVVSQLYNQILQGLLTMLSSCVGMMKLGRKKEDEWKKFIALYVRMKQQFAL